jgi:oligopeptide/dipeptide ABC transporter ATP-binding protein
MSAELPLLDIKDLVVAFSTPLGKHKAVRSLSLTVEHGETWGLAGESGSGKTVTALSLMRLFHNTSGKASGSIRFEGRELLSLPENEIRKIRGNEIAMIFQEPMTSLNPLHSIGKQIMEPLILHKGLSKAAARERALELLTITSIPAPAERLRDYPHQLSGGMRQRVMIAMALACEPRLLIADEPTTALDVTIQAQILELMKELRSKTGSAIIMITHDLGVIKEMCDHVAIMYAGQIVESCAVEQLFKLPLHPYSEALIFSIPSISNKQSRLHVIGGTVPNPFKMPAGCAFSPRCAVVHDECTVQVPELIEAMPGHFVRCPYWEDQIMRFKDGI